MKPFLNENFLLSSPTAEILYHQYAKNMPIFDYHCHLSPKEIAEDKRYSNLTEIWLSGDHYKWRAMRSNGVEEKYITGDAGDKEKFIKWAGTISECIGNPLYHWAHLELKRYFGVETVLSVGTAEEIWHKCNSILAGGGFSAKELIKRSNVKVLCTTDDPSDNLEHHRAIAEDKSFDVRVLPTFRPDKSINIDREGFIEYIGKLGDVSGVIIKSFEDLKTALERRLEYFHSVGCRISDHSLEPVVFVESSEEEASDILSKALKSISLTADEVEKYKTQVLIYLGRQYSSHGWVMQLHMGVIRNNNKRMFKYLGPDSGYDSIVDTPFAGALARLLSSLDETEELPKTILYTLNPSANEVIAAMAGCFQSGGIPGKIQFGSGWWFNDQKDGMIRQINALANVGLLGRFIGMLTDSRSFLSYTRHEYFRRILCNIIGEWAEIGEVSGDINMLGNLVKNICFNNAEKYFEVEF